MSLTKKILAISLTFLVHSCGNNSGYKLEPSLTLEGHANSIWDLDFSPDGKKLVTAGADSNIMMWDTQTGQPIKTFKEFSNSVYSVVYDPQDKFILASSYDGFAKIINLKDNSVLTFKDHLLSVNRATLHPSSKIAATFSNDTKIKVWSTKTGEVFFDFMPHKTIKIKTKSIAFNKEGNLLLAGDTHGVIRIWDLKKGELQKEIKTEAGIINTITFSPDGKTFACGFSKKMIKIYSSANFAEISSLPAHYWSINQLKYSPDGNILGSVSNDKTLSLWEVKTGKMVYSFDPEQGRLNCLDFSEKGDLLATGGTTKQVKIWKIVKD